MNVIVTSTNAFGANELAGCHTSGVESVPCSVALFRHCQPTIATNGLETSLHIQLPMVPAILNNWYWVDTLSSAIDDGERTRRNLDNSFGTVQDFCDRLSQNSNDHICLCLPWRGRHVSKCYNPSKPAK